MKPCKRNPLIFISPHAIHVISDELGLYVVKGPITDKFYYKCETCKDVEPIYVWIGKKYHLAQWAISSGKAHAQEQHGTTI